MGLPVEATVASFNRYNEMCEKGEDLDFGKKPEFLHKFVTVNGQKVNVPSYSVKVGDVVEVREEARSMQRFKDIAEATSRRLIPGWLEVDKENMRATVKELPQREAIDVPVNEMLIVELYSK